MCQQFGHQRTKIHGPTTKVFKKMACAISGHASNQLAPILIVSCSAHRDLPEKRPLTHRLTQQLIKTAKERATKKHKPTKTICEVIPHVAFQARRLLLIFVFRFRFSVPSPHIIISSYHFIDSSSHHSWSPS